MAAATDTAVVVLAPGLGDAVQMAKAGILEVADVFVVNKADREGAGEVAARAPADAAPRRRAGLGPAGARRLGVRRRRDREALSTEIRRHAAWADASGARDAKRRARLLDEVESLAAERFRRAAAAALEAAPALADDLAARRVDPYAAAAALVRELEA